MWNELQINKVNELAELLEIIHIAIVWEYSKTSLIILKLFIYVEIKSQKPEKTI